MPSSLTPRQREVLEFIRQQVADRGYPPSIREIGARFSIRSTNGVRSILQALERKGEIRRRPQLSRGIELVRPAPASTSEGLQRIPITNRLVAGDPHLFQENIEGNLIIDRDLIEEEDTFALQAKGDSMVGAGIFDGDLVFVHPEVELRQGDIVVAIIDDETTIKFYYPEANVVRLATANRLYSPIILERDSPRFKLIGKVVGLFRRI